MRSNEKWGKQGEGGEVRKIMRSQEKGGKAMRSKEK
jgi:hypothetical protein